VVGTGVGAAESDIAVVNSTRRGATRSRHYRTGYILSTRDTRPSLAIRDGRSCSEPFPVRDRFENTIMCQVPGRHRIVKKLTRSFTTGRMGAPEHLSRRDRVSFFNDHQAVTTVSRRTQQVCQADRRTVERYGRIEERRDR
jgi:hypothetical protein